jgi:hypothetical protein
LLRLWTLERKEGMDKYKPLLTATTINIPKAHSAPPHTQNLLSDPKKAGESIGFSIKVEGRLAPLKGTAHRYATMYCFISPFFVLHPASKNNFSFPLNQRIESRVQSNKYNME